MILFNVEGCTIYNQILHTFLEMEIYGDDEADVDDYVEYVFPKYLYREQFLKCKKTLNEIYEWTGDTFYHDMMAFHERAIYGIIQWMIEFQEDYSNYKDILFDQECREQIRQISTRKYEEYGDEKTTIEDFERFFYDANYYEILFEDEDFLMIDMLYNNRKKGNTIAEKLMGINIDYYFDLLPLDIQEQYSSKHITLAAEISELLKYIEQRVEHGNLYQLFWENGKPVGEVRAQLILENIIATFFYGRKMDISREAITGNGKIDFKLYRNLGEEERILVEIKNANRNDLKRGYEKQLTEYMHSGNYTNAFYLVACYTDEEIEKTYKFIRENIYTDSIQSYISISMLDFRQRKTASQL